MNWPIGYSPSNLVLAQVAGSAVTLDGIAITDADGWLELHANDGQRVPATIRVQLHVVPDGAGRPYLYVEDVAIGARRYGDVLLFIAEAGSAWGAVLADAVWDESLRRFGAARRRTR